MKREPSTVAPSLRAVSLAVTLVSIVAFSTMAYSAYADYSGVLGVLGQSSGSPAIATRTVVQGTSATVYLNVTIPNDGLYPLGVGLSCISPGGSNQVSCSSASVTVPPGGQETLRFAMTVQNVNASSSSGIQAKGNLSLSLVPFASLNIVVDLGSLAAQGG